MKDNTQRFSSHVEDYIKYRPSYPNEIIDILNEHIGLNTENIIADIGSGTGISSIPFLENGNQVYGVEPNKEMREAQEMLLKDYNSFTSINGTSEETTLQDSSVDIIFCGQAFHWFDKEVSKKEFKRILKVDGHIVLVWNSRSTKSRFQQEYEQILYDTIPEYKDVNHRNADEKVIAQFFSPDKMYFASIDNIQEFDLEGLKGRLKSSSYCPKEGPIFLKLMEQMNELFTKYQDNGKISFVYETLVYWS